MSLKTIALCRFSKFLPLNNFYYFTTASIRIMVCFFIISYLSTYYPPSLVQFAIYLGRKMRKVNALVFTSAIYQFPLRLLDPIKFASVDRSLRLPRTFSWISRLGHSLFVGYDIHRIYRRRSNANLAQFSRRLKNAPSFLHFTTAAIYSSPNPNLPMLSKPYCQYCAPILPAQSSLNYQPL